MAIIAISSNQFTLSVSCRYAGVHISQMEDEDDLLIFFVQT